MFLKSKKWSQHLKKLHIRLTLYYTIILLLLFFLISSFVIYRLNHHLIKQVDSILSDEAIEVQEYFVLKKGVVKGFDDYADVLSNRKAFAIYFRILDLDGSELYTNVEDDFNKNRLFPSVSGQGGCFSSFKSPDGKSRYRTFQKKIFHQGNYILQITTPLKTALEISENLQENLISIAPLIVLLSIAFGLFASRKPFAIIRKINETTRKITSKNLRERVPVPPEASEVKELTETINSMLERLEKSFDEVMHFTSDVSHELRNPLFAVKGELEVALSQKRDCLEYEEVIYSCLERINSLIVMVKELFLISRFDSNKVRLKYESVKFAELTMTMFDFFLPIAQEKTIAFKIDRCDDVIAYADRSRMQQVLSNLLDNSVKFTPEGGSVSLSLIKEKGEVRFYIKDTGIGIAQDEISKIFNRFYQVDASRSGKNRGSGLGLQICKRIVEAHHGSITVESTEGEGSVFIITLPLESRQGYQTGV